MIELTINMTEKEAEVLATILDCVGGDPLGPRGVASNISNALLNAGICRDAKYFERQDFAENTIWMADNWPEEPNHPFVKVRRY